MDGSFRSERALFGNRQSEFDFLLRYTRDFPLAVVEAKANYKAAADGVQQAKTYAEMLGLKFAYATNGHEIIEFDYSTGLERSVPGYPAPAELWARYRQAKGISDPAQAERLLTPFNHAVGKGERYYQQIAINRAVEGALKGDRRMLLTMATGTGKTAVAFQICWKLWSARWNRTGEYRRPRILYLADRNILVDQPKDGIFAAFGDARHKIEGGQVVKSREMYFAIYQALAEDERRQGLFRSYSPDFFDLIIVDECHRGSARDESSWRAILEYFEPAYQLGMTATPLRDDNRDTYRYFGNPIFEYSLRQGIDDGFLAPYRVHRVITEWDAAGWRPSKDEFDRYGRPIPDDEYETKDFEKVVALRARTEAIARHLTEFLKKSDRFAKTIVFCVDQEHASEMRLALNNLNSDLVAQYPDYVCRVTADEGDIGRGHLSRFQDVDTKVPTILTTSQLLTTGVDAPTCKNVVLARVIGSMSEFKQIIGRGTRVRDDYGKLWFNILDYTGSATRLFADPAFDGDPARITEEEITPDGEVVSITETEPEPIDTRRGRTGDHRAAGRRAAKVLLRRRPGRDRGPPGLRAGPERQAASRRPLHRLCRRSGPHALPDRAELRGAMGRPHQALRDHPGLAGARHRSSTNWPMLPNSLTPTPSTCCAIWPSMPRCAPGASARSSSRPRSRTSSRAIPPRRAPSSKSYSKNMPSMATRNLCCRTCFGFPRSPTMARSPKSSASSAAPISFGLP